MSEAISKYKTQKALYQDSTDWVKKLGRTSEICGKHQKGYLYSFKISETQIYYQPYESATNYHHAPKDFMTYLESAIKENFESLCKEALSKLEKDLKECSEKALKEHENLLKDAGLFVENK